MKFIVKTLAWGNAKRNCFGPDPAPTNQYPMKPIVYEPLSDEPLWVINLVVISFVDFVSSQSSL